MGCELQCYYCWFALLGSLAAAVAFWRLCACCTVFLLSCLFVTHGGPLPILSLCLLSVCNSKFVSAVRRGGVEVLRLALFARSGGLLWRITTSPSPDLSCFAFDI